MEDEKLEVTEEKPEVTEERPEVTEEKPEVTEERPEVTEEKPEVTGEKSEAVEEVPQAGKRKWNKVGIVLAVEAIILIGVACYFLFFHKMGKEPVNNTTNQEVAESAGNTGALTGVEESATDVENGNGDKENGNEDKEAGSGDKENGSLNANSGATAGTGKNDTGNLTETGRGYEGIKGTGDYNYGEALQKSLLFYELQRSGDLPEQTRCNWRGDSALEDGKDVGLDLTGGWFDAGDNVKFNLPMAYTASVLGWSILEDYDAYKESGQLEYALSNVKWANDYFIKCHPKDDVYYYQVGDGGQDHSYWGAAETVSYRMERPSYCVTKDAPGSAVSGETAASLAICSILYKDIDKNYSDLCLSHAKSLYKFARDTKSDAGYTAANGFYNSWSGFYDELAWAGLWLYQATGEETYLSNAKSDYENADLNYKWAMCWDDVHVGAAVMLAKLTGDKKYTDAMEEHLDWWTTGTAGGERITYTPKGLAWLDSWGSLRYATTTAFIAAIYSDWDGCKDAKRETYQKFALAQAGYALGDTGRSFEIGFGENYPVNPHHRTAQGSYCDNMNEPAVARHTLYGALVGGPDASDNYTDVVSNYTNNEVACDYNAGFTGLLANLYGKYHGETLVDFGAVEEITENELYVSGGINVEGQDFIEIKAYVCNTSAWPARVPKNLEMRYYMDLTEVYEAGGSAENLVVTTNYMQGGNVTGITCLDEEKNLYYMAIDFSDALIYPGGQDKYKKEVQVRIRNTAGVWDNSNDPSFYNMKSGGNELLTKFALYEDGELIFGEEPASGKNAGKTVVYSEASGSGNGNGTNANGGGAVAVEKATATNEAFTVSVNYDNMQANSTSLAGSMSITNESDGSVALNELKIYYYFTNEEKKDLSFACYHAAVNGANGNYQGVSGCSATFEEASGEDTDTVCKMTFSDSLLLQAGDTLTVNFCINHSDWSQMNTANDYSVKNAENIVLYVKDKKVFGKTP